MGRRAPVCRAGESCVTPARRTLLVFRRDGAEARTRTDGSGRYRITLAPGVWHVSLTRRGLGTAVSPATVRVVGGRVRTVGLSIDTGIR